MLTEPLLSVFGLDISEAKQTTRILKTSLCSNNEIITTLTTIIIEKIIVVLAIL